MYVAIPAADRDIQKGKGFDARCNGRMPLQEVEESLGDLDVTVGIRRHLDRDVDSLDDTDEAAEEHEVQDQVHDSGDDPSGQQLHEPREREDVQNDVQDLVHFVHWFHPISI